MGHYDDQYRAADEERAAQRKLTEDRIIESFTEEVDALARLPRTYNYEMARMFAQTALLWLKRE